MYHKAMTEGAPWKLILRFVLPVLAGALLQQLYNTVDAIVVGNFSGEAALSAVGTTGSLTFMFLAVAMGLSAGNGVIVAQFYGAGDQKQVRNNAAAGILFLMLLGVGASLLGILVARPAFVYLVNVQESYLELTLIYFRIYAIGLVFQFGYNIFASVLRAVGDSAATLYFLLITSVLNIVLDLIFVAWFHWGVAGAAAATVISQVVSFLAAYLYMTRKYPVFRFTFRDYRWDGKMIATTVRVGFPITLQMVVASMGMTLIQRAVNGFGQAMTASFTVGQRIEMYLNLPCSSFQTALATYTGQNIGARKLERVRIGVRQTMLITLLMAAMISGVVWVLADQIIILFGLSDQAAEYCLQHLRAVAIVNLPAQSQAIWTGLPPNLFKEECPSNDTAQT
ncbi:MAG: MATE family efflux transporter [Oscillospiraceae bacterium]|nr:MATE family efflux transporter [Oscillospiraceae bacterium]